jgi:hypothetical protein
MTVGELKAQLNKLDESMNDAEVLIVEPGKISAFEKGYRVKRTAQIEILRYNLTTYSRYASHYQFIIEVKDRISKNRITVDTTQ